MSRFSVEIPQNGGVIKESILSRARNFPWLYLRQDSKRVIDHRLGNLFEDLQVGAFWSVLRHLDGTYNHLQPDSEKQRQQARVWAKNHFNNGELNEMLKICIQTALTIPQETFCPGTYRGHSILFRELVEKPDSMFKDVVTEDFRKRLNNGRFWEEIPNMMESLNGGDAYKVVDDVLTNYFEDLDVGFAPQGYEIFRRNGGEKTNFDLKGLSDKGIDGYAEFLNQIDQHHQELKLTPDQLTHLVAPYAAVIVGITEEGEPRFPIERLEEPLVAKYLTSDIVRKASAKELELQAVYGNWRHAFNVLCYLPDPKEMFERVEKAMVSPEYDMSRFISSCQQAGLPIDGLISSS